MGSSNDNVTIEDAGKLTAEMKKALKPEAVRALAQSRGISEEEAVFGLLKRFPALFGAMSDWDDVRPITISVIRELKSCLSYKDILLMVLRVLNLYDTQVISVLRVFSDVKRLAYFVNEMIESMLEVNEYADAIAQGYEITADNRVALRGIVLKRITSDEVQKVFLNDKSRFFRAEAYCAMPYFEALEERSQLRHHAYAA
ncbi:MAG: hypothetical protein Q4E62_04460 [Sutterellaceae bacterium]|nr:hypothetical protein [Sutterellaceae bacterium]